MTTPRITVRALQALVAVYEEQSFSRAAARENATQSGMSTQVKSLETRLGTALMIRERGGVTLTPAGEILYRMGRRTLRDLLAAEAEIAEIDGAVTGPVRAGLIPALTRALAAPVLDAFTARWPGVSVTLVEEYSHALTARVRDGDLDFALVPAGDLPPGLSARFVARDTELIVSRPGRFDAAHLAPLPLASLEGAHLLVPSAINVRRGRIDAALAAHGVRPAALLEIDGMLGTLEMVAASDWCAILPAALCHPDRAGNVRALNPLADPPMTTDYVAIARDDAAPSRAARLLSDAIAAKVARIVA